MSDTGFVYVHWSHEGQCWANAGHTRVGAHRVPAGLLNDYWDAMDAAEEIGKRIEGYCE